VEPACNYSLEWINKGAYKMKKLTLVALLLITGLVVTTGFIHKNRIKRMPNVQVNVKDLSEQGLIIIDSSNPGYDEMVEALLPGVSKETLESVSSYSFLVKNVSNKTLVAYSLKWEMVGFDGKTSTHLNNFIGTKVLLGGSASNIPQVIEPNMMRFFSPASSLESKQDPENKRGGGFSGGMSRGDFKPQSQEEKTEMQVNHLSSKLSKYQSITISIDGALFEDGTFVGSDTTGFFDTLKAVQDARRNFLQNLVHDGKQNKSADEILNGTSEIASRRKGSVGPKASFDEKYNEYLRRNAMELLHLKKFYSSDESIKRAVKDLDNKWPELRKLKP
jgi:hypothetical protein